MTDNLPPGEYRDPFALHKPDWEKWNTLKTARLWHAVALACNLAPRNFQFFDTPNLGTPALTTTPKKFDDLLKEAKSSISAGGVLKLVSRSEDGLEESEIDLANFRKWAESAQFNLPDEFPGKSPIKQASLEETVFGERERTTLLTLIAALANEAGIDISKPSKAAGLIEGLTMRIEARIAARTIEEHLKRIPTALEKRSS